MTDPAAPSDAVRAALERIAREGWERTKEPSDDAFVLASMAEEALRLPAAAPVDREHDLLTAAAVLLTEFRDAPGDLFERDQDYNRSLRSRRDRWLAAYNRLAGQSSSQPVGGEE